MIIINNKNHENLSSNVPFDELPKWFQDAKTKDAIITIDRYLIWYTGVWYNGKWQNGTWYNGVWYNGVWKKGIWQNGVWKNGEWKNGVWYDGIWEDGKWVYGRWYNGKWHNGEWVNGVWYDGIWEDGKWHDGVWKVGIWKNGVWKNGEWKTGDWRKGFKAIGKCKWCVSYSKNLIKIGCKEKTAAEWEEWFASDEEFGTNRDTPQFKDIYKSFLIAKAAQEIEYKD